jgi:hypothetical protein
VAEATNRSCLQQLPRQTLPGEESACHFCRFYTFSCLSDLGSVEQQYERLMPMTPSIGPRRIFGSFHGAVSALNERFVAHEQIEVLAIPLVMPIRWKALGWCPLSFHQHPSHELGVGEGTRQQYIE